PLKAQQVPQPPWLRTSVVTVPFSTALYAAGSSSAAERARSIVLADGAAFCMYDRSILGETYDDMVFPMTAPSSGPLLAAAAVVPAKEAPSMEHANNTDRTLFADFINSTSLQ